MVPSLSHLTTLLPVPPLLFFFLCDNTLHLDIIVIPQAVFNMVKKLKYVQSIQAGLKKSVHALKRSLPEIQAVVDSVLERAHLYFTNQLSL